jgi:hypothetical protein
MADHPAYFIVLNGGSGHAEAAPRETAIRAELDAAGATYEILVVDDATTLSAIAKSASMP